MDAINTNPNTEMKLGPEQLLQLLVDYKVELVIGYFSEHKNKVLMAMGKELGFSPKVVQAHIMLAQEIIEKHPLYHKAEEIYKRIKYLESAAIPEAEMDISNPQKLLDLKIQLEDAEAHAELIERILEEGPGMDLFHVVSAGKLDEEGNYRL